MFDRFYRVEAHHGRTGGAGLGLSINKAVALAHGGRITIEGLVRSGHDGAAGDPSKGLANPCFNAPSLEPSFSCPGPAFLPRHRSCPDDRASHRCRASHRAGAGLELGRRRVAGGAALPSAQAAQDLAEEIAQAGGQASPIDADLAREDDVVTLIPRLIGEVGPLGQLANNASVFEGDQVGDDGDSSLLGLAYGDQSARALGAESELPRPAAGLAGGVVCQCARSKGL